MADDEFTVVIRENRYEAIIKFRDPEFIEAYKEDPDRGLRIIKNYMTELQGDIGAAKEIRLGLCFINVKNALEKLMLAKSVEEGSE